MLYTSTHGQLLSRDGQYHQKGIYKTIMIVIDRISDGFAVLETEDGMLTIEASQLPPEAKEGDLLCLADDGSYLVDAAATEERRQRMIARLLEIQIGADDNDY